MLPYGTDLPLTEPRGLGIMDKDEKHFIFNEWRYERVLNYAQEVPL
jgi:hypothetical protein